MPTPREIDALSDLVFRVFDISELLGMVTAKVAHAAIHEAATEDLDVDDALQAAFERLNGEVRRAQDAIVGPDWRDIAEAHKAEVQRFEFATSVKSDLDSLPRTMIDP